MAFSCMMKLKLLIFCHNKRDKWKWHGGPGPALTGHRILLRGYYVMTRLDPIQENILAVTETGFRVWHL